MRFFPASTKKGIVFRWPLGSNTVCFGMKRGITVGQLPQPGEVLFEFRRIGNTVKVSAIDPVTNTEISIMGPASAGEYSLKMVALRKLHYVLSRREKDAQ
jgi:hypothetical protein